MELSWPAQCRKVPGQLLLTEQRLLHVDADGGATVDLELNGKMTFEITKKRPNFDSALVRLSNHPALAPLGGRLVLEFTAPEKWLHLQRFAEQMRRQRPSEPPPPPEAPKPLPSELSPHFELLVNQLGVMSAEQRLGTHHVDL